MLFFILYTAISIAVSWTLFSHLTWKSGHPTIHKKKGKTDKENYRPISILPTLSKICERCMFGQINLISGYFNNIFLKYQWGCGQVYITQHCLLVIMRKWKEVLDKGRFRYRKEDLLKAFYCLKHNLFIA